VIFGPYPAQAFSKIISLARFPESALRKQNKLIRDPVAGTPVGGFAQTAEIGAGAGR